MRWDDMEEMQERKVVEVMAEMRGGMGNKKKTRKGKNPSDDENPWLTPDGTEQSEPERVGSRSSPAGETKMVNVQEAMEELVEKQRAEGGILDQFIEGVVVMEESQREELMRMYEASMPVEFGPWAASLWKMVEKRVEERKEEEIRVAEGRCPEDFLP